MDTLKEAPTTTTNGHGSHALDDHYQAFSKQLGKSPAGATVPLNTIGITACAKGCGSSTVAVNLAVQKAEDATGPVVLVDAHLARPKVHEIFRTSRSPGLTDALSGSVAVSDCLRKTPVHNLWVMPAGQPTSLASLWIPNFKELLKAFEQDFEVAIFDLPPACDSDRCFALARLLDGVAVVVEAERTDSLQAQRLTHELGQAGTNLLGVILNKQSYFRPR